MGSGLSRREVPALAGSRGAELAGHGGRRRGCCGLARRPRAPALGCRWMEEEREEEEGATR